MPVRVELFRFTDTTDTRVTSDRIDFNDPRVHDLKDPEIENAWLTELERIESDGVGDDQPAEENLGSIDTLGNTEDVFVLKALIADTDGFFNTGDNNFLLLLDQWSAEPKKNDNWPEGRFGIIDSNDITNTIIPIRTGPNQVGLIWESYTKKNILSKNQTEITLRFRVSKGDGT